MVQNMQDFIPNSNYFFQIWEILIVILENIVENQLFKIMAHALGIY